VYSVCSVYMKNRVYLYDPNRSSPDEPCAVCRVGRCGIIMSTVGLIRVIERDCKLIINGKYVNSGKSVSWPVSRNYPSIVACFKELSEQ